MKFSKANMMMLMNALILFKCLKNNKLIEVFFGMTAGKKN
jgi:hypothetical protein